MLLCPRCAELIDDLRGGVYLCMHCEGLWITKPAVAKLVDLPIGSGAWWRNALACPTCTRTLQARSTHGIFVDECPSHGMWLDRGELSRLFGDKSSDLDILRERITVATPTIDEITARKAARDAERELRTKAAEAYREAAEREERLRIERAKAEELAKQRALAEAEKRRAAAAAEAKQREEDLQRKLERTVKLEDDRNRLTVQLVRFERELVELRATLEKTKQSIYDHEIAIEKRRNELVAVQKQLDEA